MSGINSENSKARELKKFHRNGARACFHRQSTPATNHSTDKSDDETSAKVPRCKSKYVAKMLKFSLYYYCCICTMKTFTLVL